MLRPQCGENDGNCAPFMIQTALHGSGNNSSNGNSRGQQQQQQQQKQLRSAAALQDNAAVILAATVKCPSKTVGSASLCFFYLQPWHLFMNDLAELLAPRQQQLHRREKFGICPWVQQVFNTTAI